MDEDTKAIEWQEPEQAEEVPAPDPVAWNIDEPAPRGPDRSLMPFDAPGAPHLAVPEMERIAPKEPPKPIFGEGGWGNVDIDPDNPLPKDEPERDRGAELRRRQESRIQIHQAEKAGNTEQADILRGIEARARKAGGKPIGVLPTETAENVSPFVNWNDPGADEGEDASIGGDPPASSPPPSQQQGRPPAKVRTPQEVFALQEQAKASGSSNPFEGGESSQVLKDILKVLQEIRDSLSDKATTASKYS